MAKLLEWEILLYWWHFFIKVPKNSCCETAGKCQQLSACARTVTVLETHPKKEGNMKLTFKPHLIPFKQVLSPVLCPQGIHFQKADGSGKELEVGLIMLVGQTSFFCFWEKVLKGRVWAFWEDWLCSLTCVTFADIGQWAAAVLYMVWVHESPVGFYFIK